MTEHMMIDPLEISGKYSLSNAQIESFRQNGHGLLRGLATSSEIDCYKEAICNASDQYGQSAAAPMEKRDTYGKAFLQHKNLWEFDPVVRQFTLAERFGRVAAELMGVDGVRLYHDQALFKEPGGGLTPWHQDQYYWPVDTDHTITMWMPLVDVSEDMGMLTFASGSHKDGYLGTLPISDESDQVFDRYIQEKGFKIHRESFMQAGDATFHSGWCLHSAPGNVSGKVREVMTIIWVADGCRATEPINPNQQKDLKRWLPGLKPGDQVASALNPIVYSS